jgi:phosphotransferase family enzyme
MRWLAECTASAVREALSNVAPQYDGCDVRIPDPAAEGDPVWWFLPEVVASSADPLLLITRRVPGTSLFEVIHSISRDRAGRQLARFMAAFHEPSARERAEAVVGKLTGPELPPATTQTLRERFGTWVRPDQRLMVTRWCDWVDAVLAAPRRAVLVHGDLHGDNQVWDEGELRLVLDFETIGAADPEYDLRALPGPGMSPGVELLTAVTRHYWVDDIAARFSAVGIDHV